MGKRGIFTSFGAGMSLIVAGVLMLAIVSSVVAYHGWPGEDPFDETTRQEAVVVDASSEPGEQRRLTVRLGSGVVGRPNAAPGLGPRSTSRTTVVRRSRPRTAVAGRRPASSTVSARRSDERATTVASASPQGTAQPRSAPVPVATGTPAATATPRKPTAQGVRETVAGVADALDPQSTATAPAVQLPKVAELPATDPVVDTVNEVLSDTEKTVGGLLGGG